MSMRNAQKEIFARKPNGWLRVASKAFLRLTRGARPTGKPAPVEASRQTTQPIVGVKKSAVCKDARGQLRTIELFLPADLVSELARPLEIRFLDGEQTVTVDELGKAIKSNFVKVGSASV
jgi:hypothetical protein